MPDLNFFARLGLFVRENFLDAQLCRQYCNQMQNVPAMATPIVRGTSKVTDRSLRSTSRSEVSSAMVAEVKQRLLAIKPQLEQHFQLPLNDCLAPSFYRYTQGDFFKPHRDNSGVANAPQFIKERKLSVIIFLNQKCSTAQTLDLSQKRMRPRAAVRTGLTRCGTCIRTQPRPKGMDTKKYFFDNICLYSPTFSPSPLPFTQTSARSLSPNYTYEGGELIFYGLINDSLWQNYGFRLPSQPGLLIAFPINIIHEVKPVTRGERFTIVSWFI